MTLRNERDSRIRRLAVLRRNARALLVADGRVVAREAVDAARDAERVADVGHERVGAGGLVLGDGERLGLRLGGRRGGGGGRGRGRRAVGACGERGSARRWASEESSEGREGEDALVYWLTRFLPWSTICVESIRSACAPCRGSREAGTPC